MNVIIKFVKDARTIQVDKKIIDKYKLSIIYAHSEVFPETNEIELEATYEDFLIIYEMLTNKINQWDLPTHIYDIAHKMGFIDDEIDKMQNLLNAKKIRNYWRCVNS